MRNNILYCSSFKPLSINFVLQKHMNLIYILSFFLLAEPRFYLACNVPSSESIFPCLSFRWGWPCYIVLRCRVELSENLPKRGRLRWLSTFPCFPPGMQNWCCRWASFFLTMREKSKESQRPHTLQPWATNLKGATFQNTRKTSPFLLKPLLSCNSHCYHYNRQLILMPIIFQSWHYLLARKLHSVVILNSCCT